MKHRRRIVTTSIVCLAGLAPAQLYSPVNRYSLSFDYSDSLRAAVTGGALCFLSRPAERRFGVPAYSFTFNGGGETASAGFAMVAGGFAAGGGERAGFGAFGGDFALKSDFLEAKVDLNVYTADKAAGESPREVAYERFIVSGAEYPIDGVFDFRFGLREAYLTFKKSVLSVDVGKRKLRWGPGYKGTLALSGTAFAPFYYYHITYSFKDAVKLSSYLCGYEDEKQFARELKTANSIQTGATGIDVSSLPPRFGAAQRIDVRLGRVQLGIYEMAGFFGVNELNRFANPLSFYYVGNGASGTNNANLLGGMDCNVTFSRYRIYGEFLNDDITVFEQAGNPDKYAYQIGAQIFPGLPLVQAGLEYSHIARYVYGHSRVLNRHTFWDESLGWPWGNDQDVFSGHAIFAISRKLRAKLEVSLWLKGKSRITDDWYADGSPDLDHVPYWPRDPDRFMSCVAAFQYRPAIWATADCLYAPVMNNRKFGQRAYGFLTIAIPGRAVRVNGK